MILRKSFTVLVEQVQQTPSPRVTAERPAIPPVRSVAGLTAVHLKIGIKLDTLTTLRNTPLNMGSLFPDHSLSKAEEEISRHEQKCPANILKKKVADNKNFPPGRGVGHFHRLQKHVLPHTKSKSVQEVHAFSCPRSVLLIQSTAIWSVHSTHGVHGIGEGGQTDCLTKGYKNPPVPR